MTFHWLYSPILVVLSFPVLCSVLMMLVHGTVEFAPRVIRQHRISYRPIQTRLADWLLILRLALTRD